MRTYTRQNAIADNIKNWLETYTRYPVDKPMAWTKGVPLGFYVERVKALEPSTCTRAQLLLAMGGGDNWGINECDECGKDADVLMRFGDEPDYEARWQDLCAACLCSALDQMP